MPTASIVHARSATQLTYDFSRHLGKRSAPGDEVVFISGIARSSEIRRESLASSVAACHAHEAGLRCSRPRLLETALLGIPGLTLLSRAEHRTPTLYLTIDGCRMRDLAAHLTSRDVLAPAGHFSAIEAFRRLGLHDDRSGLRVGVAVDTNDDDIQRLLDGIASFLVQQTTR